MTNPQSDVHDRYLTNHFSHVLNPSTVQRKKVWISYNHHQFLPTNKGAAILDIGPGIGILLDLLINDLKYTCVKAIDISSEVVAKCNEVVPDSTELVSDSVIYLLAHPNTFDCICLFHVLEHIPKNQVVPFLSAIRGALKPTGRLVVEVPNMANPITGLNVRYTDFTHETGFTDLSLKTVLQSSGFSEINIFGCHVPPKSPVRAVQWIAQRGLEAIFRLMLTTYMPSNPSIITHILGACAVR